LKSQFTLQLVLSLLQLAIAVIKPVSEVMVIQGH